MSNTIYHKDGSGNDDGWQEHKFDILKKLLWFVDTDDSSITTSLLEDDYVQVTFHVHLPPKIEDISREFKSAEKTTPCVIGNIDELGNWENVVVPLKQPYSKPLKLYGEKNSTYWVSEPVTIPVSKFNEGEVKYKYAVQIVEKVDKKSIKAEEKKIKEAEKKAEKDRKEAEKKAAKEKREEEKRAKKAEKEKREAEKKVANNKKSGDDNIQEGENKKPGDDNIQEGENSRDNDKLKESEKLDRKIKEEPKKYWFHEIIHDTLDHRILNMKGGLINQFDMVRQIDIGKRSYYKRVHDYEFFKIIWKSLSSDNAKIKLKEYLDILEKFPDETLSASDVKFIGNEIRNTTDKDKRLFLSIILGYYIMTRSNTFGNYNLLGKKFPSQYVFESIEKFQPEDWLPNTKEILLTTLRASIVREVQYDEYFWVKAMFTSAHLLDPDYSFLECVYNQKFTEKYSKLLVEFYFPKYVTPNIDKIESDDKYSRIAKWMLKICSNMNQLLKVWGSLLEHIKYSDISLRNIFLEKIQFHISSVSAELLEEHFNAILNDFKSEVAEPFRRAAFALLEQTSTYKWTTSNVDSIYRILQNDQFEWNKEHHLRALHIISVSKSRILLDKFPKLLKFWFNKYNKTIDLTETNNIPTICKQWYRSILHHLNFTADDCKYVYDVFENLSYIYDTIKNRPDILTNLIEIAIDRCNQCSDSRVFGATKHIHKFSTLSQDLVTPFAQMVKEKLLIKNTDDALLQKMQQICACKSNVLEVPNV
ncbi:9292_t:CDS:2, partial [Dentiscutata heterogama]